MKLSCPMRILKTRILTPNGYIVFCQRPKLHGLLVGTIFLALILKKSINGFTSICFILIYRWCQFSRRNSCMRMPFHHPDPCVGVSTGCCTGNSPQASTCPGSLRGLPEAVRVGHQRAWQLQNDA